MLVSPYHFLIRALHGEAAVCYLPIFRDRLCPVSQLRTWILGYTEILSLFTPATRPSGCVRFTTIARYGGLIRTTRSPAPAGAATTCVCCCFDRVPCATVMSRNAQNRAELPVDYKWRKIVQFGDRLEGILSLRRTN